MYKLDRSFLKIYYFGTMFERKWNSYANIVVKNSLEKMQSFVP
jgi:hypothetical protein